MNRVLDGIIENVKTPISIHVNEVITDNGLVACFVVTRFLGIPIYSKLRCTAGLDQLQSFGTGINFTLPYTR